MENKTNQKFLFVGERFLMKHKFKEETTIELTNHILSRAEGEEQAEGFLLKDKFSLWDTATCKQGAVLVELKDKLERLFFVRVPFFNFETVIFKKDLPEKLSFKLGDKLCCYLSFKQGEAILKYLFKIDKKEKKLLFYVQNPLIRLNLIKHTEQELSSFKQDFPSCSFTIFKNGFLMVRSGLFEELNSFEVKYGQQFFGIH